MIFNDKVCFITGAGGGIGAATAKKFADLGATVVLTDSNYQMVEFTSKEIRNMGKECTAIELDVTNSEHVEKCIDTVTKLYKKIDFLILCAGFLRDNKLSEMTDEEWTSIIDTHLSGSFYPARAVSMLMEKQQFGKIVLVSSTAALGSGRRVNYSAAKAGIQGLTKSLAMALGPYNVNVNCVAPAFIDTKLSQGKLSDTEYSNVKDNAIKDIPLRRIGKPEDVANVISFLCSEDSSYISGQIIYINGGGPRG